MVKSILSSKEAEWEGSGDSSRWTSTQTKAGFVKSSWKKVKALKAFRDWRNGYELMSRRMDRVSTFKPVRKINLQAYQNLWTYFIHITIVDCTINDGDDPVNTVLGPPSIE